MSAAAAPAGVAARVVRRAARCRFLLTFALAAAPLLGVPAPAGAQGSPGAETVPPDVPGAPAATASPEPQAIPAPGEGAPPPAAAPAATQDRITFNLPFPEEQGGGEATGSAAALDYQREDFATLSGGVELKYQDVLLRAAEVSIDLETKEVTAMGDVIIDQGPTRLTGSTATYDLDTKTGVLRNATGSAPDGIRFSGEQVAKVGEDVYEIDKGVFTSCEGPSPAWSFRIGHGRIRLEDYARVRNVSMRVKKAPVFYLPYVVWPTKTDRTSGFLVPKVGNSNDRGTYLGLAYYQVLGRSWDTTLFADLYTKDYLAAGQEVRYHPTEGTQGRLRGWAIDDPLRDDIRWKVRWDHDTRDLPFGMRGVAALEDYSDPDFFRDFERGIDDKARSSVYSEAYVSGNWGSHSLNVLLDRRQTFITGEPEDQVIELQQLPEIEYRLRPTRVARLPLYVSLETAAHYLSMDRGPTLDSQYGRFEMAPRVRIPLSPAPWLSLSLVAGERFTWYGDTIGIVDQQQAFLGESLTRAIPNAGLEIIGPSFSRIFGGNRAAPAAAAAPAAGAPAAATPPPSGATESAATESAAAEAVPPAPWAADADDDAPPGARPRSGPGSDHEAEDAAGFLRYKHVVEPRLEWSYSGEFREQDNVPVFDELDPVGALGRNVGRAALINRLLAKPAGAGAAREIFSLEVRRDYSFDDEAPLEGNLLGDSSAAGPLEAILRAYPTRRFGLRLDADYSMLFSQLTSLRASGNFSLGRQRLDFTWTPRWQAASGEVVNNQASLGAQISPFPSGRLSVATLINYDIEREELRDQRHLLTWSGSCWAARLELHESNTVLRRRRDYLFSIDLKNVGTFLDLTGGETTGGL